MDDFTAEFTGTTTNANVGLNFIPGTETASGAGDGLTYVTSYPDPNDGDKFKIAYGNFGTAHPDWPQSGFMEKIAGQDPDDRLGEYEDPANTDITCTLSD